jgi:hypothetical protein
MAQPTGVVSMKPPKSRGASGGLIKPGTEVPGKPLADEPSPEGATQVLSEPRRVI